MCGFLGQAGSERINESSLIQGLAEIEHRGPDETKYQINTNWALGFNRLRILDLSSHGSQPMSNLNKDVTITFNGESITRTFQQICEYPAYNFMFINKYGMWENFATNLPVRGNVGIDKQRYEQTFVNYASDGAYDVKRRGETNYSTGITENLTISTDWLSQEAAQWITQLIESDEVYVAVSPNNTVFKPIVITNASYVQNTGRKDQKTFMYDITFRYANQRIGR